MFLDITARTLFLPVLAYQAVNVRKKALKLPEASGLRSGVSGKGAPIRLLVVGDSSAAGVGVETQSDALFGQLVARLSESHEVRCKLIARTGATTASTLEILRKENPEPFDIIVTALGVNDITRAVSLRAWLSRQKALTDLLITQHAAKLIYISGLPPVGHFPLLPHPLRWVLGRQARRFDRHIKLFADAHPRTRYVQLAFKVDVDEMAEDGYHPGPKVYAEWAALIAESIAEDWPGCADSHG